MKLLKLFLIVTSVLFSFNAANAFDWKAHSGKTITILMNEHPVLDGIRSLIPQFEADTGIKVKVNALAEDLYFDRMEVNLRAQKVQMPIFVQWMQLLLINLVMGCYNH